MPKYVFRCENCQFELSRIMPWEKAKAFEATCEACRAGKMIRLISAIHAQGKVTVDEYRGKSMDEGVQEKIKERAEDHFRKHELPRIIEKHGLEYAIRQGFVDLEGKPQKRS